MLSFTLGRSTITVFLDNQINTVDSSHPNFAPLGEELRKPSDERDMARIRALATVRTMFEAKIIGNVGITEDGTITYKDQPVTNYMTRRMIQILSEGYDITPWANFMENVMSNPAEYAHHELYEWMEKADMPITEDGYFIAFKKVRSNYTDCHTGRFDNSVGTVLEMDRELCDPDRSNHCSTGFHFCSAGYLSSFGGQRVMILKINPRDVTSIPDDYSFTKGRTCRYEVIGELSDQSDAYKAAWQKGVVTFEDDQELPDVEFAQTPKPLAALPSMQTPGTRPRARLKPLVTQSRVATPDAEELKAAMGGSPSVVKLKPKADKFGGRTREEIVAALAKHDGVIRAAARDLGVAESSLRGWKKQIEATPLPASEASPVPKPVDPAVKEAVRKLIKPSGGGTGNAVMDERFVFKTMDGRTFTVPQIEQAFLVHRGARPAARELGVSESTLRGWRNSAAYKDYYALLGKSESTLHG